VASPLSTSRSTSLRRKRGAEVVNRERKQQREKERSNENSLERGVWGEWGSFQRGPKLFEIATCGRLYSPTTSILSHLSAPPPPIFTQIFSKIFLKNNFWKNKILAQKGVTPW
jgi:hypothetical protein